VLSEVRLVSSFYGGAGDGAGAGGDVLLYAGPGGATGKGGDITVRSGAGGSGGGNSGHVYIDVGMASAGSPGTIYIGSQVNPTSVVVGNSLSPNFDLLFVPNCSVLGPDVGGGLHVWAFQKEYNHAIGVLGSTTANANGGNLSITSGEGQGTGTGGDLEITAANGGSTGNGGDALLRAGHGGANGNTNGGKLELYAGDAYGSGTGGSLYVKAGGCGATGTSGDTYVEGGYSTAKTGGHVYVLGGDGTTDGQVYIATSHTYALNLPDANDNVHTVIGGVDQGDTYKGENLKKLHDGSDATGLHYHTGLSGASVDVEATAYEDIAVGNPVLFMNDGGTAKVWRSEADFAGRQD